MCSEYSAPVVRELVRASFSDAHAWGWSIDGTYREVGMPRLQFDPYRQSTLWACVADGRRAFDALPAQLRRRVYLSVVMGLPQVEVARREGVTQGAVWQSLTRADELMLTFLNGDEDEAG